MTKLPSDEVISAVCQVIRGYTHAWEEKKMITQFYVITQPIAWRHHHTCIVFPFPHIFWSNQMGYGHCRVNVLFYRCTGWQYRKSTSDS